MSCDDGKIYEESVVIASEGRVLSMSGRITGIDSWPDGYSIVVAGFGESEFAVISKPVPASAVDGEEISVDMSGISGDVTRMEICVINQLRKKIVSFYELDCSTISDTIKMQVGIINAGMFTGIQKEIFNNSCISCHGVSGKPGAGLYLTEGKSFEALVGKISVKDEAGKLLVEPGKAADSFLHEVLNTDITGNWRIVHSDIVTSPVLLTLIDKWIDAGAKE
ncbi:hypothetical protein [uncultured Culturomica sp.]|uniref:hypothetical protein n=1 Tax=uncultured Culturomica sp. TaxID=1926654 RepID=UPI00033F6772|nr:hypothetical protein [uncultured Culturomica sp.]CCZ07637.1 putative uncharacterized protein [Odoribacter sp. CAG:788]